MSWSFGNKMWTVPFKSLNGTSCRVDIYMRNYTGSQVFTLTGADNPFSFEENDDNNILTSVMRYRTGYLRIVEEYESITADIYPTAPFDRYIEAYYGTEIIFNGFIQVQNFSRELLPTPRVLDIPVISPLGLFDLTRFSNTAYLPPTIITLGELLDVTLQNQQYSYVYCPHNYGYPNPVGLSMVVSTLVASPWNPDYSHSQNVNPSLYLMKGQPYSYIVEGICLAFGWIVHDTPDALIFTAFDHEGDYARYPVGHVGDSNYLTVVSVPSTAVALTDYLIPADNAAQETTLQPDIGIEISYEGETGDRSFRFEHTYVPTQDPVEIMPSFIPDQDAFPNHAEIFSFCKLFSSFGDLTETDITSTLAFDANDKLIAGKGIVAWNGMCGVLMSIANCSSMTQMFYLRFFFRRLPNQKYSLTYKVLCRADGALGGLNYAPDEDSDYYVLGRLDVSTSHMDYVQANFYYRYGGDYPQLPAQALLFIYDIKLEVCEQGVPYEEYIYPPVKSSDYIPSTTNPPAVTSSITMPISLYRLNDNLIGTTLRTTKVTEYPYLFQPRRHLVSRFRVQSLFTIPYARIWSYLNKKWRIIALSWDPWNDEMKVTAQHSPTL